MIPNIPMVPYGKSTLYAVPAIHGDHVFASAVLSFCLHGPQRPKAIAVELGPWTARSAASWVREVTSERPGKFPVMLGLLGRCRLIRPSLRDKAFALQQKTGKNLDDLPPDILRRELGFSGSELLCLSPTDSIIEAIRCAIEWDIPLHGVDLDEVADVSREIAEFPDSLLARGDIATYIDQNAPMLAGHGDAEIDPRREIVMAARLKSLLAQYETVLFTCGFAHWNSLQKLLADASLKPAQMLSSTQSPGGSLQRVIVHPQIASAFLDRFPIMAPLYEEWRARSVTSMNAPVPEPSHILKKCLGSVCRRYFSRKKRGNRSESKVPDWDSLPSFEAYLCNLGLLNSKSVPNLSLVVTAALETMSRDFSEVLVDALMDLPWVSPADYPDYPLLSPNVAPAKGEEGTVRLESRTSPPALLGVRYLPGLGAQAVSPDLPYRWKSLSQESLFLPAAGGLHTWLPWDYRNASMCLRAAREARNSKKKQVNEVFEGSLLEGIDVKATLRGFSRGDEVFFVRDRVADALESVHVHEAFPIVWILKPDMSDDTEWMVLREPTDEMEIHVRDKKHLREVQKELGCNMVSSICYVKRGSKIRSASGGSLVVTHEVCGQIIFHPPFATHRQCAVWAESTGYRRNPFFNYDSEALLDRSDLAGFYAKEMGLHLGTIPWASALVLMGLPFAEDVLPVVVPEGYRLDRLIFQKASEYGVAVRPIRLEVFDKQEVQFMMTCHMSSVLAHDHHCIFPGETEQIIGESQSAGRDWVPHQWLDFDLDDGIMS